ncbi:hypothetical protein QYF36_023202 [Acer negundo]|nr:hypothetical protein QYF36_023202 [Acer negundo]
MNEEAKALEVKNKVSTIESDLYGLWMQVSYGRSSRNYLGNNFTGKRNVYGRKSGSGDKHGTSNTGMEKPIIKEGTRKGMDVGSSQVKMTPTKKSGGQVTGSSDVEETRVAENQQGTETEKQQIDVSNFSNFDNIASKLK